MASITQTHADFVAQPMHDKPVSAMPGIGRALGTKLKELGIEKASQVYGQYLVFDQDEENFKTLLQEKCGANRQHQQACYNGLRDWYNNHK